MLSRLPIMRALDKNGDGELSEQELADAAESLNTIDANKDGKLESSEIRPNFAGRGRPGDRPTRDGGSEAAAAPKVGHVAPDFDLSYVKEPAKRAKLSSFAGKKPVALIFGSCT
jgi:hypothetical protein